VRQPEQFEKKDYHVVLVSFQSTGGLHITTVNALNRCELYTEERQRGRGSTKRKWAIEMNEGRKLYLTSYCAVDKIDQMLRVRKLRICMCKWWHHPTFHGAALGMCMAYEFYKMCAEGGGDPSWAIDKPMSGPEFREMIDLQMLQYNPMNLNYSGDAALRAVTRQEKKHRAKSASRKNNEVCDDGEVRVGLNSLKPRGRGRVSRFGLASSEILKMHLASMKQCNGAKCDICGKLTFWRCELCNGARMCLKSGTSATTMSCVLDYHAEDHYGLVKGDRVKLFGVKPSQFDGVKPAQLKKNCAHMNKLRKRMYAGEDEE
jgi:hypothetical protein